MTHHIYHTRGVILSSVATGESNRFYKIFTEELGLVGATAQSVREGKSKLRYTLQDLSSVTVDLVRGKEIWRIVSAGAHRPLEKIKNDPPRLKLFARFCSLISRLVQGEGRDQELFGEIERVMNFLEKNEVEKEYLLSFETLLILRVLVHLGYMNPLGYERFVKNNEYSNELFIEFEQLRLKALPQINEALNASHL